MERDFNPLGSQRDAADFMRTMAHLNNQDKQNALSAEQVRLQREANELEKKRQAQQAQSEGKKICQRCQGRGEISYTNTATNWLGVPKVTGTGTRRCDGCGGTGYVKK